MKHITYVLLQRRRTKRRVYCLKHNYHGKTVSILFTYSINKKRDRERERERSGLFRETFFEFFENASTREK